MPSFSFVIAPKPYIKHSICLLKYSDSFMSTRLASIIDCEAQRNEPFRAKASSSLSSSFQIFQIITKALPTSSEKVQCEYEGQPGLCTLRKRQKILPEAFRVLRWRKGPFHCNTNSRAKWAHYALEVAGNDDGVQTLLMMRVTMSCEPSRKLI